jgi:hypothetical protein
MPFARPRYEAALEHFLDVIDAVQHLPLVRPRCRVVPHTCAPAPRATPPPCRLRVFAPCLRCGTPPQRLADGAGSSSRFSVPYLVCAYACVPARCRPTACAGSPQCSTLAAATASWGEPLGRVPLVSLCRVGVNECGFRGHRWHPVCDVMPSLLLCLECGPRAVVVGSFNRGSRFPEAVAAFEQCLAMRPRQVGSPLLCADLRAPARYATLYVVGAEVRTRACARERARYTSVPRLPFVLRPPLAAHCSLGPGPVPSLCLS